MRDKAARRCPQTTTFEEKEEPKRIRTEVSLLTSLYNALTLDQTGSRPELAVLQLINPGPATMSLARAWVCLQAWGHTSGTSDQNRSCLPELIEVEPEASGTRGG